VFTEWFPESFEPSVKTFLKKQNFSSKALSILIMLLDTQVKNS
jgi:hypothetical protein